MTSHVDTNDMSAGDRLRHMVDTSVDRQWDTKVEPKIIAIQEGLANMRQREQGLTLTVGELQRGQRDATSRLTDLEDAVYGNEKHGQSGIVPEIRALRVSVEELKRLFAMVSGGAAVVGVVWQFVAPFVQEALARP